MNGARSTTDSSEGSARRSDAEHIIVASRLAADSPHVRSALDVPAVMRCVLIAAAPCVAVALYNIGYQANLAAAAGAGTLPAWRADALSLFGVGSSAKSLVDCMFHGALVFLPLFAVSLFVGAFWERWFARMRARRPDHVALPVIALLFTLSLPPSLPLWQAALGASIAIVLGKEIFGGFGRNFMNPALTGFAFLYFSFPQTMASQRVWIAVDGYSGATPLAAFVAGSGSEALVTAGPSWAEAFLGRIPGSMGETSALACALGALVMIYTGVASWRIIAGGLIGLCAGVAGFGMLGIATPLAELAWYWHGVLGSFAFALVFLATDPVTSPFTNPGRWIYGAFIGAMVVVIRVANPAHHEGAMLAVLLGNASAPLIDHGVARVGKIIRASRRDH